MNFMLPAAKQALLEGRVDWRTDPIFAVLIDNGTYTFSPNHASLADVPPWARVATSGAFTNKTTYGGVADADDVTFSNVSGNTVEVIGLFNGTDDSALYMAYIDQAQGLPVTPAGNDIVVHWDNGTRRIFAI